VRARVCNISTEPGRRARREWSTVENGDEGEGGAHDTAAAGVSSVPNGAEEGAFVG